VLPLVAVSAVYTLRRLRAALAMEGSPA
jgi:hypothetical protein